MKTILHVVGARPNFMKAAPVLAALGARRRWRQLLVHTGQHYDASMSDVFFRQLGMSRPDYNLEVGSGSHACQTAAIMVRLERILMARQPALLLVYGDVNSTVAAALVATKLGIPVGHVEAGLRSRDRSMPEEINRILTDQISDLLFTPSRDANENLRREGVAARKIFLVGNVMIDSLVRLLKHARKPQLGGIRKPFALVTLHRPSNVDEPAMLRRWMQTLKQVSGKAQVIFPVHPRTRRCLKAIGFETPKNDSFLVTAPLGYLEFLWLQKEAAVVITDSGGIQEEATFLRVPCLTLRTTTERPVTVAMGTNRLIGRDPDRLLTEINRILAGRWKRGRVPPLWDGKAAQRIAEIVSAQIP